jgi:hypothetical protein
MEDQHEALAPGAFEGVDLAGCQRLRQIDAANLGAERRIKVRDRQHGLFAQ